MTSPQPPRSDADGPPSDATGDGFSKRYFRSGLGLREEARDEVATAYRSDRVQQLREHDYRLEEAGITFRLAHEFGFCYGVERAIDYAYEAVRRFPESRIVLIGEIIHNHEVNARLRELGIRFLGDDDVPDVASLGPDDVVLLPAFGVPVEQFEALRDLGPVIVDTTCGSVLNVWKNVERYARDGRTSIVHGKATHEETEATVSRVHLTEDAHYVVVLHREEAELVASYIRGDDRGGTWNRDAFLERFRGRTSEGFDPDRHLARVGMANQTTMLSGESLAIAQVLEEAIRARFGADELTERFRSFSTICSATQERQDALRTLLEEPLDLMLVIGGYNSSNTGHLLEIAEPTVRAFHIKGPASLVSRTTILHKPAHEKGEVETVLDAPWLPDGDLTIGLTAGASTPDLLIGKVVERVLALRRQGADADA